MEINKKTAWINEEKENISTNLELSKIDKKFYGFLWKQKISKNFMAPKLKGKIKISDIEYSIVAYNCFKKSPKSPDIKLILTKVDSSNNKNKMTQLHLGGLM
jgi:hypothetical protein